MDCEHRETVLPLCFGVFESVEGPGWLYEQFERKFENMEDYFDWLGEGEQIRRRECNPSSASSRFSPTIDIRVVKCISSLLFHKKKT